MLTVWFYIWFWFFSIEDEGEIMSTIADYEDSFSPVFVHDKSKNIVKVM